jgi:hypothetical protein
LQYIKYKEDGIIRFTIVFQIALLACKNMTVTTLQAVFNLNDYFNVIIAIIMAILYIRCFLITKFRIKITSFLIILSASIFFAFTYLCNNNLFNYYYVISGLKIFIVYCIPLIILVPLIQDTDKLLKDFYFASYIMCTIAFICFLLILAGAETVGGYSMSYGQAAMIPSIFLFSKAFKENSVKDFILAFLCTIAVFILASRWPLICIGTFIVYGIIRKTYSSKKRLLFYTTVIIPIIFLLYNNYMEIMIGLNLILNKIGLSSRTINLLLSGNIGYDSGREQIHLELISRLMESPILGYGAFGGNVIVGLAHNFILDTWANFGFIFGSVILLYSIYMTINRFWLNRASSYGELIAIYACMFWPKITIGESFWSSDKYWMLISLILLGGGMKSILPKRIDRGKT